MNWWQRLFRRRRMEEQLEKELRFHVEQHAADLIAQGVPAAEARRKARLAIGGPEQVKEECRDARGTRWLEDFLQDLRHALRAIRLQPGFAVIALLTIALGIGATTVMFTVINGVLLKPLAYPEPDRLLALREQTEFATRFGNQWAFAYLNFLDCRREVHSLEMGAGGTPEACSSSRVRQSMCRAGRFVRLDDPSASHRFTGRTFLPEEDRPGGAPVILISHGLWQALRRPPGGDRQNVTL